MWKLKFNLRNSTPSDADKASIFFERMEPRILFSADALSGLVPADPFADSDTADTGMNARESASFLLDTYAKDESNSGNLAPADADRPLQLDALQAAFDGEDSTNDAAHALDALEALLDGAANDAQSRQEIIFVDAATPDYEVLLEGIADDPNTRYQIVILQSGQDGIEQMTRTLDGMQGVDAIHLVSHGNQQGLQLGDTWLSNDNLDTYNEQLKRWAFALDENADLLIYGCDLAAGAEGRLLISQLAELTTADVAASDDLTGAAALGGDWQFEYNTGDIESGVAITTTAQQTWSNVLATINVTITGDIVDAFDGETSLREAITLANGLAGLDEIVLGADTYTLSIAGNDNNNAVGDLDIRDHLIIRGAGATNTIIDGGGAALGDRVFETVNSSQAVQFSLFDLAITNAAAGVSDGGALFVGKDDVATLTNVVIGNNQAKTGGGIAVDVDASLNLDRVIFSNNVADDKGGALSVVNKGSVTGSDVLFSTNSATALSGGAINNFGNVSLDRVLFDNNNAVTGGAIHNEGGTVKLSNATLSGNNASVSAGAINNIVNTSSEPGTLNIVNSTFTANTSPGVNGILQDAVSIVDIRNSILNDGGSNISGGTINSLGNNIDSDGSAALAGPGDLVGNPMLGALADNGGYTQTHALLSGSIAINSGNSTGTPVTDQRDQIRIGATDIGAYEFTDYGLIWGDVGTDSIVVATLDGNHATDLITGLDDPTSVAIDPDGGKVYWANVGTGTIERANLDGSGREVVVSGLGGPIAIDLYLAGGKIYWTDGSNTLLRANLDGSSQEIISGFPVGSTGVAVDGPGGMVYWVDDGSDTIGETSLTGAGTGNLVTTNVGNTADLALDLVNDKIYWTNTSTGQLWRANLSDGLGVINLNVGGTPYGLALDPVGNKTYWMDSGAGELYRVDLSNGANRITLYSGLADPRDVDFFTM
ncbi:MAG: DUF4347 domain-containing protein, partial [Gammaproteobacteria bacterium]|nr:DUF4347 domain-containing protein [Gammaproteobacteria bacterium]